MDRKLKAVTFSYDDGLKQDARLIEIFNKYNLKSTFNIVSDSRAPRCDWTTKNGILVSHLNIEEVGNLYDGHEIACHTCNHLWLNKIGDITLRDEIERDKKQLSEMYNTEVVGIAYPFGTYDGRALKILKENNFLYARGTRETLSFDIQDNLLEFMPTCHHRYPKIMELAEEFINMQPDELKIFYIWGHSYDFDVEDNWEQFEDFCKYISGRKDIFYGTNREVFELQRALMGK